MEEMAKRMLVYFLGVSVIFVTTVLTLNYHLKVSTETVVTSRHRFIPAHERQGGAFRFKPERLAKSDPMDLFYDVSRLNMLGIINSKQDEKDRMEGEKLYAFNGFLSSKLSLNRAIPDTRHRLCREQTYRHDLPQTSVIICFYNEAWSTLLRTVHSVINRTPKHLLYEIVLVDDASEHIELQNKLAEYLWGLHPNITLVRTPERQGLIRARMYGAHEATGEVLVFLDSHCEVNAQWLEPLLRTISNTKKPTIAVPVIDSIKPGNFEYKETKLVKGGFNWGLHFRWDDIADEYFKNDESYVDPIETPTMAGGLFAVRRQVFREMGEYDAGMDTWGGENLEISFRYWMCGGQVLIVPCSRVGHVFRSRRPYGSPNGEDSMLRNSARLARVWMDDYIQHFFQTNSAAVSVQTGDLSERMLVRDKLNCKPFSWYLKYIYPEQTVPGQGGNNGVIKGNKAGGKKPVTIKQGKIVQKSTSLCILPEVQSPKKNTKVVLDRCDTNTEFQTWRETDSGELSLTSKLCLAVLDKPPDHNYARLMKCTGMGGSQDWVWSIKNMVYQLYNPASGKCLVPKLVNDRTYLVTAICTSDPDSQFIMLNKPDSIKQR